MRSTKCTAKRADGSPCGAWAVNDTDRCVGHATDPEIVAAAQNGRQRGGRSRAAQFKPLEDLDVDLSTFEGVQALLATAAVGVLSRRLSASAANAISGIAREARAALEDRELEERLDELEQHAAEYA